MLADALSGVSKSVQLGLVEYPQLSPNLSPS